MVRPAGYFSKTGFCKIFYFDKDPYISESDENPDEKYKECRDMRMWWISLYFTPEVFV
jgi:hypothetical protein